ncbi:hypothetical protein NG895_04915 [Aeoliella sp. ICT_H6.2]|uniref:Uncharacterized protein n=1 Tax=Aeoliella straminimaris TaxID=2954799 RepID=A0A9X2F7G2_9BACT|nr:hypothetical protein [Aeoliella straminimaris]MCO6043239.1 hypothetical protein [Aeoliella straminimaris]
MSSHDDSSNTFDPLFRPLMDYWTAYTRQLNEAAEAVSQQACPAADEQSQGREWLDAASKSIDAYLRSPLFLGLLKSHLDTLIELKRQSNALGQMATAAPQGKAEASGAAQVGCRLDELSAMLVEQLSRIEKRLEAVEKKLDNSGGPP